MKALSIRQPWSWLIVHGHKTVENRPWATKFRGEFLVHAGKTFDVRGHAWVRAYFPEVPMPDPFAFERGGIVGQATLVDCVTDLESRWACGPHVFVLRNPIVLPFAPFRGLLGFFDVPWPAPGQDAPGP